jgi:hypothetical protein
MRVKGEHSLRTGDTNPNIRDMFLKRSQKVVCCLLTHLYEIIISKDREAGKF